MESAEQLRAALVRAGLANHEEALMHISRFGTRIKAKRCELDRLTVGASRFGGQPDLPSDFDWPSYEGRPHAFLAQLDLSAIPRGDATDLPDAGWLVFFYECETMKWGFDPADRGSALVRFIPPTAQLHRREPPVRNEYTDAFHACSLFFVPTIDPVDPFDELMESIKSQLSDEEEQAYFDFEQAIRTPGWYHHILGNPQIIQNGMRRECQLAANGVYVGNPEGYQSERAKQLADGWRDWELLLQIDTDEEGPGWMWGDGGRLYLWMRRDDMRARKFEAAWLILQCS